MDFTVGVVLEDMLFWNCFGVLFEFGTGCVLSVIPNLFRNLLIEVKADPEMSE